MNKTDHTFHYQQNFILETGEQLPGFQLKYTTAGALNADRSNVIWVCHALTGSSDFTDWWGPLFASGSPFNTDRNFVICANILGGCYGSTGPLSIDPRSSSTYYHQFPQLTNRDVVRAFDLLRQHLRIDKVKILIGGSLGGQHVLEWAIQQPTVFEHIIPIACNAQHSPWGIAFNEAQRMAIEADATWREDDPRAGINGLKAARAIGMVSYRHYDSFQKTQQEKSNDTLDNFRSATYQRYQGDKLANRFNTFTYWLLTKMMDSHNVGRDREAVVSALKQIQANALVVGIDSDLLFPIQEQELLAKHIPHASFETLSSLYGHDGFLVEYDQLKTVINNYLRKDINVVLQ